MAALGVLSNTLRWSIVEYIKNERKATYTELKDLTNLKGTSLNFHLKRLIEARIVERTTERGPYKLTPIGEEAMRTYLKMQRVLNLMEAQATV
jgi:predicted transcriptional regulator